MFSQFKNKIKENEKINTISKKIQNKFGELSMNGASNSPTQPHKDRNFKLTFGNQIFIPPPLPVFEPNPNLFKSIEQTEYSENPFSFYYEEFQEDFPQPNLTVSSESIPNITPEPTEGLHPYGFGYESYSQRRNNYSQLADTKPHFLRASSENPIRPYASIPANQRCLSKSEVMQCLQPSQVVYICVTDTSFTSREKRAFMKKLGQFSNLETLILKSCGINAFANGTRFPQLRFCDLSNNSIRNSSGLKKLTKYSLKLEVLNLSGNPFAAASEVENKQRQNRLCSQLTQLENISNKLIPVDDRITAINLHGPTSRKQNIDKIRWELNLDNVPEIRAMRPIASGWQPEAILQLNLSGCQLRYFNVGHFVNLNSLDLSANGIVDITTSGMEKCTYLQFVNLSSNQISRVESVYLFEFTPSIRCVHLHGNPFFLNSYRKEIIYRTRDCIGTNRSLGIQQIDHEMVSIEEKVSVISQFESNKKTLEEAQLIANDYRWKLLIIERYGHKQLQNIPNFFHHFKTLAFPKSSLIGVEVSSFANVELIDFSQNDLISFTGLNQLYKLRILYLQENPRLDTTSVIKQLSQLENLEAINFSVTVDANHVRSPSKARAYRDQLLAAVIPKNRKFSLLDNTSIGHSERVQAYTNAGYSADLVEKYKFFLALTVNCTLPFNRGLYPDQVEIGQQYNPMEIISLRRLRDWSLSSDAINFQYFQNIEEIDLTNNRLTDITNIGLQSLNKLTKLCVINNQISTPLPVIAHILDHLTSLEIFAIRGNPIMMSPSDRLQLIGHMSTMKSPSNDQHLKVLDTEITIFDKVEGWKLVGASLRDAELLKLSFIVNFKSLDLYDHQMLNLELCDCALEYLDVTPFVNLKTLLIPNNRFRNISNIVGLENLKELFALDLRNNELNSMNDIKNVLLQIPNLRVIGLIGNPLSKLATAPSATYNYRPKFLSLVSPIYQSHGYPLSILDSTEITCDELLEAATQSMPSGHSDYKKEQLFSISLLRKSFSPDYTNLTELDLSYCSLTYLNFKLLPSLIILSLSDNSISDSNIKDSGLQTLQNLRALDIRNNKLKKLSIFCKVFDLLSIETLFIDENPCFEKDTQKERVRFFKKLTNSRILTTFKYMNGVQVTPIDTVQFSKKKK
ncbi:hypothetical protein DICPUDRAFT_94318 [Dictyostelium purpureum]|uniref:Uncharacterized protein n=1 Tax=Dictyostelium purpureum TaxID=5786 RepID=F0ZI32_DICPU|nr:uncharacterized protein DICPUDRAFT_94318 [Dictyostelium purpureum]EGC36377.1 hypothetical protein DICPUDRAFT_94318 [Dictyostelium purpureum]|eukprot:XP_003287074.1 hypothetical protein DICPUDRAFT_94318 [Dictyostelium purpureum]